MNISKEDYLKTIYELYEENDQGVKSIDIAKRLNVSKPSVTEMMQKLSKESFIQKSPYKKIKLTNKGRKEAKRILHNHRVIEVFLKNILNYNIAKVHEEAHRLEHAFSEESIKRLDNFLKNPKKSPYGNIIPH